MPAPQVKRVYEVPAANDGLRILVDRLWPRGIRRETAAVDQWLKDLAPSNALRQQFHARPEHWHEFLVAYAAELHGNPALDDLRTLARQRRVTLLYASRDTEHNNAVALLHLLGV